MSDPAPHVEVQPAATVMLVRDAAGGTGSGRSGPLEVLLVRRHPESVFAADAWVFPGGRVDPGDAAPTPVGAGPSDADASRAELHSLDVSSQAPVSAWRARRMPASSKHSRAAATQ